MNPNYKKIEGMFQSSEKTETILESLYELWIDRDPVCGENVRQLYRELGEWMEGMSVEESDRVTGVIAELCTAYSHGAFLGGAKTAGLLIREILLEI